MKKASLLIPHQSTKLLHSSSTTIAYKENKNVLVPRTEKSAPIEFAICGAGKPPRPPPIRARHADAGRHATPAPARASQGERERPFAFVLLCCHALALSHPRAPRRARSCNQAGMCAHRALHAWAQRSLWRAACGPVYVRCWIVAVV